MIVLPTRAALLAGAAFAVTLAACSSGGSGGATPAAQSPNSSCKPAHPNVPTLSKGTLQVSVYVSPPYSTQPQGGSVGGVDGTIVTKLAQMECLTLDAKPQSGAAIIAGIQAKRADLGIGGIYYTADRAKTLNLSTPMYHDGMALLSRSPVSGTLDGLKGKTVGVIQGYLWNDDLQKALGSNVKVYQSSDGMITDLLNGRLDVGVFTSAEAGYRAKQEPSLKVTEMQPTSQVAASQNANNVVLAITKSETQLTAALNADIKTLLRNGSVKSALTSNGMSADLAGAAQ